MSELRVSQERKRSPIKRAILAVTAGGVLLAGCSAEAPVAAESTSSAPVPSTTLAPTPTLAPSTTETTPTPTVESTSATAEIVTTPTLCDAADKLGVTAILGEASCRATTTDGYFTNAIDGAHWQSSKGTIDAKVFPDDPNTGKFAMPMDYHVKNVQFDQRKQYGLENVNALCSSQPWPPACYALEASDPNYGNQSVIYEVSGGNQDQNLTVLGHLANASQN